VIEDAITICVKGGYNPDWLVSLDCENFGGIYSSVMRVKSRDRMWDLNVMTVAMNPQGKKDKNRKNIMESLKVWIPWAEIKQSMGDAAGFTKLFNKDK